MQDKISNAIKTSLEEFGIADVSFNVSHAELDKGDYASNVALIVSKTLNQNPKDTAEKIKDSLSEKIDGIEKIEVAGPGFLNFHLANEEVLENLSRSSHEEYGSNGSYMDQKVIVEYTDPNPFKEFHIGHLMSNTVGESLSRLIENGNAKIIRANYQGDVGLHIGKALFGIEELRNELPQEEALLNEKVDFIGRAYVLGSQKYEDDAEAKARIKELNKLAYTKSDTEINKIYDWGREVSLEAFEIIYKKLGTKFNKYYFESEMAKSAEDLVRSNVGKVFEESDGAIVFKAEEFGLHTRVFINSEGLPTYEAKDLALAVRKFGEENPDLSIVITANEQKNYFLVVLKALSLIYPEKAARTKHITHGMMRLPSGKMSSRLGNIVTGESLLSGIENLVLSKLEERGLSDEEKRKIVSEVAVGAIKYSILKAAPGKDINFDFEKSISFEGDSGPYMQYTAVRIKSLLNKAEEEGIDASAENPEGVAILERMIYRFPEVVEFATKELAPQIIATYLIELCSAYNSYYASHPVIGSKEGPYRLYLSKSALNVITRGLWLLGISIPDKM